ncbi:RusA family crossover junction endodeoxyribonuclease [Bacillus sp. CRN 9]|nr:RusA family crossover junction endodeoxyribonuclease [Bacillus sp. CRN 9]
MFEQARDKEHLKKLVLEYIQRYPKEYVVKGIKKVAAAESGELRPVTKPDVDNYVKGIKDALKSVIWQDDSQVVDLLVSRYYSQTPRVEITIQQL